MSQLPLIKYVDKWIQMSTEVSNIVMQNLAMISLKKTCCTVNEKMHGVLDIILTHVTSKDGQMFFHIC